MSVIGKRMGMWRMKNVYKTKLQRKMEDKLKNVKSNQFVLMFHSISPKETWYNRDYCMTAESFENLILGLGNKEVTFASLDDICAKSKWKTVFITFDDIFSDVFSNAYPILKKYKIPFAVFVTADFIDKHNMISGEMLSALSNERLCTIGAHTLSHRNLSECRLREQFREIYQSKCILEYLTKKKVAYCAYPYGNMVHIPLTAVAMARFAGYKMAFSTIAGPVCNGMRFMMPRINVNEHNWKHVLNKCSR